MTRRLPGTPLAKLPLDDLRRLFDLAVDTPLLCSGSFDTDDVNVLRRVAEALGVDPETITPDEFITQYEHRFKPRQVNRDRRETGEWRTPGGTVVEEHAPGTRYVSRPETDEEYFARLDDELSDLGCQAGTYERRCGRLAHDPKHRKN